MNEYENIVTSWDQINREKLKFDLTEGAAKQCELYHSIRISLHKNDEKIVFQCVCGRLGILPSLPPETHRCIKEKRLLCPKCGNYELTIQGMLLIPEKIQKGLRELLQLFERAVTDNYMTLCYYFWSSLLSFKPKYDEVTQICDQIYDMAQLNVFLEMLQADKLSQFEITHGRTLKEEKLLHLTLINHVFEIQELYDVLLTILKIANSEHFLIGEGGNSINGVGLKIAFDKDEEDRTRKRVAHLWKEVHGHNHYKLSKLIHLAFNSDIRNAYSHSGYKIVDEGIYLIKNKRLITNEQLSESFLGAYFIQKLTYDFIALQRQKFIDAGGYSESGWTISPEIENGGISIKITGQSPLTGVTGRIRKAKLNVSDTNK